jgi:DNA polymerase I
MIAAATPTSLEAFQLLMDGAVALAKMESNGIRVSLDYLDRATEKVNVKIAGLKESMEADDVAEVWRKRFGNSTNLGSRPQLGTVLYEELGYRSVGLTTKGTRERTDESALEKIDLPFVRNFLKIESLKKTKATYLDGLRREVVGDRVHPCVDLNIAVTFRSNSSKPNFQNQPVRDPEQAELIRPCYVASNDRRLVEVDFSSIEVRTMFALHKDPTMGKYLHDPTTDMHRDTSMGIFLIDDWESILPEHRKTVRYWGKSGYVFPAFYGSVYFQCAPRIWEESEKLKGPKGIPMRRHLRSKGIKELGPCNPKQDPRLGTYEAHIKKFDTDFWEKKFPVYNQWKKTWYNRYLEKGWFRSLTGFKYSGLMKRNDTINYANQGTAYHCQLWCQIRIQRWIDKKNLKTKIVGSIHDSLLFDCPENELNRLMNACVRIMTEELPAAWKWIICPLEVEIECSDYEGSWHSKAPWAKGKDGIWGPKE